VTGEGGQIAQGEAVAAVAVHRDPQEPPPTWCASYVGIPYLVHGRDRAGLDCWGLVVLVSHEIFSLKIPDLSHQYADTSKRTIAHVALEEIEAGTWTRIEAPAAAAGDIVLLNIGGLPRHCGILTGATWMLHTLEGAGSVLEHYTREPWKNRIGGFFRYAG
jgi:cell wall-associated NlpC family hydrolase